MTCAKEIHVFVVCCPLASRTVKVAEPVAVETKLKFPRLNENNTNFPMTDVAVVPELT